MFVCSTSIDSDLLNLRVFGFTENRENPCRIISNYFEVEEDGLFIFRYLLHETCYNFQIHLKYNDHHIGKSPYHFKEPIHPEKCYCPRPIQRTLKSYQCPHKIEQIEKDLKLFPTVDYRVIRKEILKKFNQPNSISICNYVIKDNQIYRKCFGKYIGFRMFIDGILVSLARKVFLPGKFQNN